MLRFSSQRVALRPSLQRKMIEKKIITMEQQEISYSAALAELEEILRTIETGEADIDTLSSKVTRATELIKLCRARLTKVESQVKEILEG